MEEKEFVIKRKKKKSVFDILLSPLKHLCKVLGITGVRILSVIMKVITLITTPIIVGWVILMAVIFFYNLVLGHHPESLPYTAYLLLLGLTFGFIVLYNLIRYVADYLLSFADAVENKLTPRYTSTTEEPKVVVVFQDETKPSSGGDIVVEGDYTEIQ